MNSADQNALAPIAEEVLEKLQEVADAARAWLRDPRGPSADTLVPGSVSEAALRNLGQVNQQNRTAYQRLSKEPAYLGLACEGVLPAQLDPVRHHFAKDWTHKMRPSGSA